MSIATQLELNRKITVMSRVYDERAINVQDLLFSNSELITKQDKFFLAGIMKVDL